MTRLPRPILVQKLRKAQALCDRALEHQIHADACFAEAKRMVDEVRAVGQWPETRIATVDGERLHP